MVSHQGHGPFGQIVARGHAFSQGMEKAPGQFARFDGTQAAVSGCAIAGDQFCRPALDQIVSAVHWSCVTDTIDDAEYSSAHGLADQVDVDELQVTPQWITLIFQVAVQAGVVDQRLTSLNHPPSRRASHAPTQPTTHHQLNRRGLAFLQADQFLIRTRRAIFVNDLFATRPTSQWIDRRDVKWDDHSLDMLTQS